MEIAIEIITIKGLRMLFFPDCDEVRTIGRNVNMHGAKTVVNPAKRDTTRIAKLNSPIK
jgi:hypothetical protein